MTKYSVTFYDGENNAGFVFDRDDVKQLLKSIIEIMAQMNTEVIASLNITQMSETYSSEKKRSKYNDR